MTDPVKTFIELILKKNKNKDGTKSQKKEPSFTDDDDSEDNTLSEDTDGFDRTSTRDHFRFDDENSDTPLKSWSSAIAHANLQQVINGLLAVALCVSLYMNFNQKPTIIMKPPMMLGDIKIENGLPNADWKRSWGLFFSNTIGNVYPRNVEFVTKVITSFMAPELQEANAGRIRQLTSIMKMRGVTQEFQMQDIAYDEVSDLLWVWGYKTTKANNISSSSESSDDAEDRRKWTFEMIIKPTETGTPKITYLNQYEGTPKYENANNVKENIVVPVEDPKKKKTNATKDKK